MATSPRSRAATTGSQISLLAALPANPSASRDSEAEWQTSVATWPSNILGWLAESAPAGWSGRTSPASCQAMEDGTLVPSSGAWANSGMGSPTECLTLSTSAAPRRARVCSWSRIMEIGGHLRQYYLSDTLLRKAAVRAMRKKRHAMALFSRQDQQWLTMTQRLAFWKEMASGERRR